LIPVVAVSSLLALGGVAAALSGGDYSPDRMDCTKDAEAYDKPYAQYGCHNLKVNVESGDTRYAEFGIDQMPNGDHATPGLFGEGAPGSDNFPHGLCAAANTGGTNGKTGTECGDGKGSKRGIGAWVVGDLNEKTLRQVLYAGGVHRTYTIKNLGDNGFDVEFGADDNLDGGEHDGFSGRKDVATDGLQNGPSDGGSIGLHVRPLSPDHLPDGTNITPFLMFEAGSCADGICEDVTTHRHEVYRGGADKERNAADYSGREWDPMECDGASLEGEKSCDSGRKGGPKNHKDWYNQEGHVYADPGVQIYEDPDSAASPIDPIAEFFSALGVGDGAHPLYPLPGFYVGTCGVIVQGKPVAPGAC
jgi:hypothetical protein